MTKVGETFGISFQVYVFLVPPDVWNGSFCQKPSFKGRACNRCKGSAKSLVISAGAARSTPKNCSDSTDLESLNGSQLGKGGTAGIQWEANGKSCAGPGWVYLNLLPTTMQGAPSIMLLLFCFVLSAADSSLYPFFVICGSLSKRSLGGQVNSDVWPDTTSEEFQEGIPSQLWWICLLRSFFQLCESSDWEYQASILLESWAMCFWSQGLQWHMYK